MPKTKEQKQEIIKDLEEKLKQQKSIVLVDFEGLDSKTLFSLRDELKENECQLKIVKRTILKKILEKKDQKEFLDHLNQTKGQLGLVFGFKDEILPSKITYSYSKDNENLKILGGVMEDKFNDTAYIIELAKLPSREELLGRLVGSMSSPVSRLVRTLKGSLNNLVCVLNEIQKVK